MSGVGSQENREAEKELLAFGVPPEVIAEYLGGEQDRDFQVFPENWETVQIFLASATQWRIMSTPTSAHWIGLDYQAVESVMRIHNVKNLLDTFTRLRVMEGAALSEMRKKK